MDSALSGLSDCRASGLKGKPPLLLVGVIFTLAARNFAGIANRCVLRLKEGCHDSGQDVALLIQSFM